MIEHIICGLMDILSREKLAGLVAEGYRYAAIADFTIVHGKTTMHIIPLYSTNDPMSMSCSITSILDPMIAERLDGNGGMVEVTYKK
jgi:hypothetical protein